MNSKVSAYIRVKDEINTIDACLKSIEGIFDRVVIIHSNEKDDGTVDFINEWCKLHSNYEVYEYPYSVIPSHDKMYLGEFDNKNTLAAYNAGIGTVKNWLANEDFSTDGKTLHTIPYKETADFVTRVTTYQQIYQLLYPS